MTRIFVILLLAVVGLAFNYESAAVYDRFDQVTSTPLTSHTRIDVKPPQTTGWQNITFNGATWVAAAGLAVESSLVNADHKIVIDSRVSDTFRVQADITRNSTDQLVGLVVLSDGTNNNNIFSWHDAGANLWVLAQIENGSFSTLGTAGYTWNSGTRTVTIIYNDGNIRLQSNSVDSNPNTVIDRNVTAPSLMTENNTYHGLFARDGSNQGSWNNFSVIYNPQPEVEVPVDFTPFLYIAGMLAGLILIGYGETHRTGQYIMAGALLFVAATIPTGIAWLIVISGLAFIPAMYRGYVHIVTANNQGRVE